VQKVAQYDLNSRVFVEIFAAYSSFVRRLPTNFKRTVFKHRSKLQNLQLAAHQPQHPITAPRQLLIMRHHHKRGAVVFG
jgi:hypothetical protein